MNGEGTLYDVGNAIGNTEILYKGSWKNNKKHGLGREFNPLDSSNYMGTFY